MNSGIRWSQDEVNDYLRGFKGKAHTAVPLTDTEPDARHVGTPEDTGEEVHPRYRIKVHQRRRRLTDPDGLHVKAAIDGLVVGGILPDDSPSYVEKVEYSQERVESWQQEETIIELWEKEASDD